MEAYLPIGILFAIALAMAVGIFVLSSLLGPKNPTAAKMGVYECGVDPAGSARQPFKNRFYLIAVLFLLFDVEAAFFFPWALIYRDSLSQGASLLIAMLVYLSSVVLALAYVYRKKTLELL